jgi:hypothetical protein
MCLDKLIASAIYSYGYVISPSTQVNTRLVGPNARRIGLVVCSTITNTNNVLIQPGMGPAIAVPYPGGITLSEYCPNYEFFIKRHGSKILQGNWSVTSLTANNVNILWMEIIATMDVDQYIATMR